MDFYNSPPYVILAVVFGVLVLISLLLTGSPQTINARAAVKKTEERLQEKKDVVLAPLSQRQPPAIIRHTPAVKLETKSLEAVPSPVSAPEAVPSPVSAPAPAPVSSKSKLDATFDAYRNAMKASSQRSADAHSVSIAQKAGSANSAAWREQSSSLRSALRGQNTAAYLESMHQSVDDRLVAMFDAVPV